MFNLKNIKTPHGNHGQHFFNMLIMFVAASFAAISFGNVATDGAALIFGGLLAGSVGMISGLLLTIVIRAAFSLVQTGRFLQYASFWAGTYLGVVAADWLFAGFASTNPIVLSLVIFALAFAIATLSGEVPWRGRTWLPKRKVRKS